MMCTKIVMLLLSFVLLVGVLKASLKIDTENVILRSSVLAQVEHGVDTCNIFCTVDING
jgi:hypothetical protein